MTPNECVWTQDGAADGDLWATDCRNYFRIDDGTPTENKMRYCCYCAKPLRTVPFEEITDDHAGQFGTSDAPDNCTECGAKWASSERLHTSDNRGIGGWEDWMLCDNCGCSMFFPVTHRPDAGARVPRVEPGA